MLQYNQINNNKLKFVTFLIITNRLIIITSNKNNIKKHKIILLTKN